MDEEKRPTTGMVVGCDHVNIREKPSPIADSICKLKVLKVVEVIEEESTDDFYKVVTAAGIEGYCMKQYISIGHPIKQ